MSGTRREQKHYFSAMRGEGVARSLDYVAQGSLTNLAAVALQEPEIG